MATCGGYNIIRTLGFGGNAVVKLVEKGGIEYAMKIFEPHPTEKAEIVKKTQEEMAVVQGLKIAAIPEYVEFQEDATWAKKDGSTREVSFLVMENCQGVELIEFLNQSKRQDDTFVRYIFQKIGKALHQLHASGVAHRDIKPENIIILENFDIKLIDLGYGVALSGRHADGFNRTTLGTPMYMAPEIVAKQPYQGSDADLFAFGVTLMVARLVAYPFSNASMNDDVYKQLQQPDTSAFWRKYKKNIQGLNDEFIHLINSMLAKDPATRPTMADVLGHPWFRGEVVSQEQFVDHCEQFMEAAKAERLNEQQNTGIDYSIPASAGRRRGGPDAVEGYVFDADFYMNHSFKPAVQQGLGSKSTTFLVNSKPLDVMTILYDIIKQKDGKVAVSEKSWKLKFEAKLMSEKPETMADDAEEKKEEEFEEESKDEEVKQEFVPSVLATASIAVELHEQEKNSKYLVSFTRKEGSNLAFQTFYDDLQKEFIATVGKEMEEYE